MVSTILLPHLLINILIFSILNEDFNGWQRGRLSKFIVDTSFLINSPSYKCFIKNKRYVPLSYIYFQHTVFNKLNVICNFDPLRLFLPLIIEFNRVLFDHFKRNSWKMLSILTMNKKSLKYVKPGSSTRDEGQCICILHHFTDCH